MPRLQAAGCRTAAVWPCRAGGGGLMVTGYSGLAGCQLPPGSKADWRKPIVRRAESRLVVVGAKVDSVPSCLQTRQLGTLSDCRRDVGVVRLSRPWAAPAWMMVGGGLGSGGRGTGSMGTVP